MPSSCAHLSFGGGYGNPRGQGRTLPKVGEHVMAVDLNPHARGRAPRPDPLRCHVDLQDDEPGSWSSVSCRIYL